MSTVEHDEALEVVVDEHRGVVEERAGVLEERQEARKRVQARRDFGTHLVTYLVVNAFLVLVWAVTGTGYFWPIWIIGGWGVGLVLHAWDTFLRKPVTEADVDAELTRQRRS
jgi:2TM domain-containing protein